MRITDEVKKDLQLLVTERLEYWQGYIPEECECQLVNCECQLGCLTVGLNNAGSEWNYQTGDNSCIGDVYSSPNWAITWFSRNTSAKDLFEDLLTEISHIEIFED